MNLTVFNLKDVKAYNKPLFLPEMQGLSIQRFDVPKYPFLLKMLNTMLSAYWLPEEIPMDVDKSNFSKMSEAEEHVVISNIKSQILLDSIMGRAPDIIFGPALGDPVLEAVVKTWSFQEMVHSKSYTYIIQNSFSNPEEVLSGVMDIDGIVKRSETITAIYDACTQHIADYYEGKCSRLEAVKYVYLALHGANALESIRFPVSFACSFAFAQNGILPGLGNIISLINRDENSHAAITSNILAMLPSDDEDFAIIAKDPEVISQVQDIWKTTYYEELEWTDYLFSKGEIFGLNARVLKQYLTYVATFRLKAINVGTTTDVLGVEPVNDNPIRWINEWINNKANQPAPQETELVNYERGVIDLNDGLSGLDVNLGF